MPDEKIRYSLEKTPIQLSDVERFLYSHEAGGTALFVGVTRRWTKGRETKKLVYESYDEMALKEMKTLLEEACHAWPVIKACILHRLGTVPPGEPSVLIGVSTPHRSEAFDACRYLIDELKMRVPIWKHETYADGAEEWVTPGINR